LKDDATAALIERKRDGRAHSRHDIEGLIAGYCEGRIDDEMMEQWLHAVMSAGMTLDETAWLTHAMASSGTTITWSGVHGTVVDKHSTGGVGDDVSLVAVPLAAACGVKVAKLSGRALGHTGGTIDKLECIPGLATTLSVGAFKRQVAEIGCAIAGASADLAPADQKMYSLRHRTNTIASVPLIAASILSKKIAGGAPYLVIDVKAGRCAFMSTLAAARELAETIVGVGVRLHRTMSVLVTDMESPLASSVGDTLELDEALQVLQGQDGGRLREVALAVAEAMLSIRHAGVAELEPRYESAVLEALRDGSAYVRFAAMVQAQDGNLPAFQRPGDPASTVRAGSGGYVTAIDGRSIGEAVAAARLIAGASAGVRLLKREGDAVREGDPLLGIYGSSASTLGDRVRAAVTIGVKAPAPRPAVLARLHAAPKA
jgi:pyrimidine-nucleoside phosphorylase